MNERQISAHSHVIRHIAKRASIVSVIGLSTCMTYLSAVMKQDIIFKHFLRNKPNTDVELYPRASATAIHRVPRLASNMIVKGRM